MRIKWQKKHECLSSEHTEQIMKKHECWPRDKNHDCGSSEKGINKDQVKQKREYWKDSDLDNISPVEKTRILQTIQQWLEQGKMSNI